MDIDIINLFRKIITSLTCIRISTADDEIRNDTNKFLENIIRQYEQYLLKKDVNILNFEYSELEIVDFCNRCYEKVDIFTFAEDLEYGYIELMRKILDKRKKE